MTLYVLNLGRRCINSLLLDAAGSCYRNKDFSVLGKVNVVVLVEENVRNPFPFEHLSDVSSATCRRGGHSGAPELRS